MTSVDLSRDGLAGRRALVMGLGLAGQATVAALRPLGVELVVVDDRPDAAATAARELGVPVIATPTGADLERLVGGVHLVLPGPGVPEHHEVWKVAEASGVPVVGELDLAQAWTDTPMVAVTGTNGKTTVTVLVGLMLERSGVRAVVAGNNDLPLVTAVLDHPADVYVVEASSFRLAPCRAFRPLVGTWLNLAPDHFDWHVDMASYAAAKARIWAHQRADDVAVAPTGAPEVTHHHAGCPSQLITFGDGGHWSVAGQEMVGPDGFSVPIEALRRRQPHDVRNALAAAATAVPAGATAAGIEDALRSFTGLPHRMTLVGEAGGVRYYDDSKATTPDATLVALEGLDSSVLIAGGRNKGLDLSVLAHAAPRLRGVVAIGEAASDVVATFEGRVPVATASSMEEAVACATGMARAGDAVVLSPSCASFDWYGSYVERGDHFIRVVAHIEGFVAA